MGSKNKDNTATAPTAREVREWAEGKGLIPPGQRGRLGTHVVDAFNKGKRGNKRYTINYTRKPEPTVKHTVKREGKPPVTKTLPVSQVRALAVETGHGKRGPLSKAALDAAFAKAVEG